VDKNNNRQNNLVLVDYKTTTLVNAQDADSKRISGSSKPTGNGRIRTVLILGVVAIAGTLIFNSFATSEPTSPQASSQQEGDKAQPQADTRQSTTGQSSSELSSTPGLSTVAATKARQVEDAHDTVSTPNFIFNSHNEPTLAELPSQGDVPLLEVESIDETMPAVVAAGADEGNPLPLIVALPELANDYTREPSQILLRVEKGDTLSGILSNQGLTQQEIASIVSLPEVENHLINIKPGQEIEVNLDATRRLTSIKRVIDLEKTLFVERHPDNIFVAQLDFNPLDMNLQLAEVNLQSSLYLDGSDANLSEALIMDLHSIFQWSVDFKRDVRAGDKLAVLYEGYYKEGKKVMDGNILAAEYQSSAETHRAYRHVIGKKASYYDHEGRSLQKRFLRNPIKARITSRFNLKRKHPILHTIRAHRGVDYGARTGTPVHSAGDGRVIFMGIKGGFGNTVEIQHGKRYTTLYAHLSKFPKNMKNGSRVTQGDVIGYVGSTGLATGPHLHYEFRVDGKHYDPQKVKLPGSHPLVDSELVAFKESIRSLDARFAALRSENDTLAMR